MQYHLLPVEGDVTLRPGHMSDSSHVTVHHSTDGDRGCSTHTHTHTSGCFSRVKSIMLLHQAFLCEWTWMSSCYFCHWSCTKWNQSQGARMIRVIYRKVKYSALCQGITAGFTLVKSETVQNQSKNISSRSQKRDHRAEAQLLSGSRTEIK